jgi:hypothetical protein
MRNASVWYFNLESEIWVLKKNYPVAYILYIYIKKILIVLNICFFARVFFPGMVDQCCGSASVGSINLYVLGFPDQHLDPLDRDMDPDPAPDSDASIIIKNSKKNFLPKFHGSETLR